MYPLLGGYQKGPERAAQIAAGIYEALRHQKVRIIDPPASFEDAGQKVRSGAQVLDERFSTCIDLAVVYAAGSVCRRARRRQEAPRQYEVHAEPARNEPKRECDSIATRSFIDLDVRRGRLIKVNKTYRAGAYSRPYDCSELFIAEKDRITLAHWSSGYGEFHEPPYVAPLTPPTPPVLRCADCSSEFATLDLLREHVLFRHPISRPTLFHRGVQCGDARLLIQRQSDATQWGVVNCTWARVGDTEVQPTDLGEVLSTRRGIVGVELGNDKSRRHYEFDISVATSGDLEGVDRALADLIENHEVKPNTINDFIVCAQAFPSAQNYSGGIAEYLYWFAARTSEADPETSTRHRNKLNQAAHLLRDIRRPAADAVTSLISFHLNHFDAAADRALSPRLATVATRLDRMLSDVPGTTNRAQVQGELAGVERLLMDEETAKLLELCSLSLDRDTTNDVVSFESVRRATPDTFKVVLFSAEHHLATRDPRAEAIVRTAGRYGLPEGWVNDRLDLITTEGFTWQTAPTTTAPAKDTSTARASGANNPGTPTPMKCSPEDDQNGHKLPQTAPSMPRRTPNHTQKPTTKTATNPRDKPASQATSGGPLLRRILRRLLPWLR